MSEKRLSLCPHCRHRKIKFFKGQITTNHCKKGNPRCYPNCYTCGWFSRSLKSRLGMIKDE